MKNNPTPVPEKEKIMPDGRPFFAWENELDMLRRQSIELKSQQKEVKDLMAVLKIVKIVSEREPMTGDMVIRIRSEQMVNSMSNSLIDLIDRLFSQQKSQSFNEGYLKALRDVKKDVKDFKAGSLSGFGSAGVVILKQNFLDYLGSKLEELREGK